MMQTASAAPQFQSVDNAQLIEALQDGLSENLKDLERVV